MSSRNSLASVDGMYKKDENEEEYIVAVDVSKAAVVQRTMKWAGLKPVSFYISEFRIRLAVLFLVEYVGSQLICLFPHNKNVAKEFLVGSIYK